MVDAPDEAAELFAPASAAIAEAKRLAEEDAYLAEEYQRAHQAHASRATFSPEDPHDYLPVGFSYR